MNLNHLGLEERYIWERLFSPKEDDCRERLKKASGETYSMLVKGLDAKISAVRQLASKIRQLAVDKGAQAVSSLEYEDLLLQAKWEAGMPGYSFLQVIYFDALINSPKKDSKVSQEDKQVISHFLSKIHLPYSEEELELEAGGEAELKSDGETEKKKVEHVEDKANTPSSSLKNNLQTEVHPNENGNKLEDTQKADSQRAKMPSASTVSPAPTSSRPLTTISPRPAQRSFYGNSFVSFADRPTQWTSYHTFIPSHPDVNQPSLPPNSKSSFKNRNVKQPRHKNNIATLRPSESWNLYLDESYCNSHSGDTSFTTGGNGIIAGVLNDAKHPLPRQPKLHAAQDYKEKDLEAGDKLIENILSQEQCGVLALPVHSMESAQSWADCIITFLGVVLRILPMPGKGKVQVTVWIEQRSDYSTDKELRTINDICLHELAISYPERAKRLQVSLHIMDKENPFNAYPDSVAYTCFARKNNAKPFIRERFQATKWDGICFLNYPVDTLKGLWDCLKLGHELPPETWSELLSTPESQKGLVESILNAIGIEAIGNFKIWEKYLQETIRHLNSPALNLDRLQGQLDWLKRFIPIAQELPPKVRLLWLTSKLAQDNHLGKIQREDSPTIREFYKLAEALFDEAAPVVCFAHLHLAVAMTNAFQFEEAQKIVQNYLRLASCNDLESLPPAIPGLRYYGQLLSTCGQHEAFLGNQEAAINLFQRALKCFERLSENKEREIKHTQAYLVTSLMDFAPEDPKTVKMLEHYIGISLEKASPELAISNNDTCKYQHHILLRFLTQGNHEEALMSYLAKEDKWQWGVGHPWELIEFYRGLLLQDKQKSLVHLKKAYELAKDGGPTLKVIAAVILGSILLEEPMVIQEYQSLVQEVIAAIPALGARGLILTEQPKKRRSPLELAQAVLPFNFR